jgi:hypothetical protein
MPILTTDLKFKKTTSNLGGAITASVTNGSDIFDTFTGDETAAGTTEYACIYLDNDSALTATTARMHIDSETAHAGVNFTIGLGSSAINGTEQTIVNKNTAPAGVTFIEAADLAAAITLGDLPAGNHKAVWIKAVIAAATLAKDSYTVALKATVDSGE